jgi:hypothetical protein
VWLCREDDHDRSDGHGDDQRDEREGSVAHPHSVSCGGVNVR